MKNPKIDTSFSQADPCVAGRGDQYIEHGGYTWRTLDGAEPSPLRVGAVEGPPAGTGRFTRPLSG